MFELPSESCVTELHRGITDPFFSRYSWKSSIC